MEGVLTMVSRLNAPRVLVVEDDPDLSGVLADGLRRGGFQVIIATSAVEAISKLTKQKFECVLLDLRLPGGGERVISMMRKERGYNFSTPIVVMSGFIDSDVVKRIRTQVSDILVKPFKLPVLVEKIKHLVPDPAPPA